MLVLVIALVLHVEEYFVDGVGQFRVGESTAARQAHLHLLHEAGEQVFFVVLKTNSLGKFVEEFRVLHIIQVEFFDAEVVLEVYGKRATFVDLHDDRQQAQVLDLFI